MKTRTRMPMTGLALLAMLPVATPAQESSPMGTPLPGQPIGTEVRDADGPEAFLAHQLTFGRVAEARDATDDSLRALFEEKDVGYEAPELYMRVLKHERVFELWARDDDREPYTLIKEYPVCALPGQLGPKQQMGDFQVPEGFYFIDEFNPESSYHLSLRVSYPNMADRMRREAIELGGDIFVHGGCQTVGCVPIENDNIQEVYWLAARAMDAGQRIIPIHIFPSRMDDAGVRWLRNTFMPGPELLDFWTNLAEGYAYFEETGRVPWITVAQDGRYSVPAYEQLANADAASGEPADTVPGDSVTALPGDSVTALPGDSVTALPGDSAAVPDSVPADSSDAAATGGAPG